MSLPGVDLLKTYWIALKWSVIVSVFTACMTWSYIKGGERWRRIHQDFLRNQQVEVSRAQAQWELERQQLIAQISLARTLARSAAQAAEQADADIAQRIDEAVRQATSSPMTDDVRARVNQIIAAANK